MAIWRPRSWAAVRRPFPIAWSSSVRRSDASYGGLVTVGRSAACSSWRRRVGALQPGTPATGGIAIGGDGGLQHNEYLLPVINTAQAFGRIDYEFASRTDRLILQLSYGATRTYEANQTIANTASLLSHHHL